MGLNPSEEESQSSQRKYLLSVPGALRIANCVLGLICIILSSIGFSDEFQRHDGFYLPYLTYYGLGYKEEGANICSLILICGCFTISLIFLCLLLLTDDAVNKWKAWNRFLNLFLTIVAGIGWICGFLGLLLFRQGCCHVEILSSERIPYATDGYLKPCLCIINPHNDPEHTYPILIYQDAPTGVEFLSAQPHHYNGHVANLIFYFCNVCVYAAAVWKVS